MRGGSPYRTPSSDWERVNTEVPLLRNSERASFGRCQHQWLWGTQEGLIKRGIPAKPLWFGTGVHIALAEWYVGPGTKRGRHPAETWSEYASEAIETVKVPGLTDDSEDMYIGAKELGIEMLENYIKLYGKDEHMYIIQPEQTFDIDVPWPKLPEDSLLKALTERRRVMVKLVGTYDLAYRNLINKHILLEEHKTAAYIRTEHLSLDNQGGTYWATAGRALKKRGLIKENERLRGIEYNFLRKGIADPRPRNAQGAYTNKAGKKHYAAALMKTGRYLNETMLMKEKLDWLQAEAEKHKLNVVGDVSKRQPPPLFLRHFVHRTSKERGAQLRKIQDEALQIELVRSGIVRPTKTVTRECSMYCPFFDLCELDDRGGDTESFKRGAFIKTDWYAEHRKSTDE